MITRSKAKMATQSNRSESPEFDVNNQLGETSLESENTSIGDDVALSTLRARGQPDETQSVDLNMILAFMKQQATEQKQKAAEQKQQVDKLAAEQRQLITELKQELRGEQKRLEENLMGVLDTRVKELTQSLQQRIDNFDCKFKERDTEINKKLDGIKKKNELDLREINTKLDKYTKENEEQNKKTCTELQEIINTTQEGNNNRIHRVEEQVKTVISTNKDTAEKLHTVSEEKAKRLDEINTKLTTVKENQEKLQRKVEEFEVRTGSRVNTAEPAKDISFNGSDNFPMEFLQELSELQEAYYPTDNIKWVGRYLIGEAAIWWRITRNNISNFEEFKEAFAEKYWGAVQQEKVRDQLEYGKFSPNGRMDMIQYMERKVLESRQLIPVITDRHLIKKLARHYDREVQTAVVTRGIQTISKFESLLKEYMEIQIRNRNENKRESFTRLADKSDTIIKRESGDSHKFQHKEVWGKGKGKQQWNPNNNKKPAGVALNAVAINEQPSTSKAEAELRSKNEV